MYLHNCKQWVGRRECVKGKLCLNFDAAAELFGESIYQKLQESDENKSQNI